MRAVERGDLAMVTNMIENLGADVNARCSAKVSSSSSVSSSGATLTTINTAGLTVAGQGNSALSLAILNAHVEIVRYLVNKDADVNITVIYEDSSVINKRKGESLLNLNASDFVSIPEKKATILQLAERSGNADIIEIIRSKHK
jgi:ankyrin repeat protein